MKNKGFTLVELLAVIAILGILMTLASASIISVLTKQKEKIGIEEEKNLSDAAVAYFQDLGTVLKKCSKTFDPKKPDSKESSCYKLISVEEILKSGLFTDDNNYCKKDYKVVVYRYQSDNFSEYRSYVEEHVCR